MEAKKISKFDIGDVIYIDVLNRKQIGLIIDVGFVKNIYNGYFEYTILISKKYNRLDQYTTEECKRKNTEIGDEYITIPHVSEPSILERQSSPKNVKFGFRYIATIENVLNNMRK